MKSALISLLYLIAMSAGAQRSTWNVHPLNMVPCQDWIYPEPGCGGCSSCRSAVDEDPAVMDGDLLQWSPGLVMCPHPVDTLGNNAVIISDWPVEADPSAYIYGRMEFHEPMRIDTLELTCAAWSPGIDSVDIAVQFNETDPLTSVTIMRAALSGAYQHYTVTGLGQVPANGNAPSYANFYVRTHGTDVWLLLRELRVVASAEPTAAIRETDDANSIILPNNAGVTIRTLEPTVVSVCDAAGRLSYTAADVRGTLFLPLNDGLSIVRAGAEVRRIVH